MEKEELINIVKEWVNLDNEIRVLDREIKERKAKRKQMSDLLVGVMKNNEIDSVDINDSKLVHKQRRTKSSISKKYLTECLGEYFNNDSEQVDNIIAHIMESRKIDIKDVLMRKFSK